AAPIRKALGDTTPESVQLAEAQGGFSAANLEAVHEYGIAMEQQFAGKMEDALKSFGKAAELDPNFARAYSGMSAAYRNMGRPTEAEKYAQLAMQHIDNMTERERYRLRGIYYLSSSNWQKCVEEYSQLVQKYPSDNMGIRISRIATASCETGPKRWRKRSRTSISTPTPPDWPIWRCFPRTQAIFKAAKKQPAACSRCSHRSSTGISPWHSLSWARIS